MLLIGKKFGCCLAGKASILGGSILIIIGLEIWYLEGRVAEIFVISALEIAAGQSVMCIVAGILFIRAIRKTGVFSRLGSFGNQ